jgi:hypothetical protein
MENKEREATEARKALGLPLPQTCGALSRLIGPRTEKDRPWREYPIGTKAHAFMGGYWVRVEQGWKWHVGSTFPRPGDDAIGMCIEMPNNLVHERNHTMEIAKDPHPARRVT